MANTYLIVFVIASFLFGIIVNLSNYMGYINILEVNSVLKEEITKQQKKYEELKNQKGLVNPTYSELLKFIARDATNYNDYIEGEYTCVDFANTLVKNLMKEGYFACTARVEFEDVAHAIVVVNTTDKGLVYIEPQDDSIIKEINVGDNYCSLVNWDCYWTIIRICDCFTVFD